MGVRSQPPPSPTQRIAKAVADAEGVDPEITDLFGHEEDRTV